MDPQFPSMSFLLCKVGHGLVTNTSKGTIWILVGPKSGHVVNGKTKNKSVMICGNCRLGAETTTSKSLDTLLFVVFPSFGRF